MNRIFSTIRLWFNKSHSIDEDSKKASSTDVTTRMLAQLQQLCATLPQGKAEVLLQTGAIQLSLTWNPENEQESPNTNKGVFFALNGQNKTVEYSEVILEEKEEEKKEIQQTAPAPHLEKPNKQLLTIHRLIDYLRQHYTFRYNRLTDCTECAPDGKNTYQTVDNRLLNSISLQAMQAGIPCWDRDVKRYIESCEIPAYHPFISYMEQLPQWDGIDRVTPLAQRVSTDTLWIQSFHRWMLANTEQWMNTSKAKQADDTGRRANSVAPILVSTQQGMGKSTFCRMLLPHSLQMYFTESFDLTNPSSAENKLTSFGLINLDEFDRLPASRMPQLKNLMQMECINLRRAYKHSGETLPRIACFIGTSNRRDLLTDLSGSRRFICVEIKKAIDCTTPIDYEQLYAQLKYELENGERSWFSKEEERKIQQANRAFYRTTPAEELLAGTFRFAEPGEEKAYLLSAAQIYTILKSQHPAALRDCTPLAFSKMLAQLGRRVHTKFGNGYWVVREDIMKNT